MLLGTSGISPTVELSLKNTYNVFWKLLYQHDNPVRCSRHTCSLRGFLRCSPESDIRTRFPFARRVRETLEFVTLADLDDRSPWIKHRRNVSEVWVWVVVSAKRSRRSHLYRSLWTAVVVCDSDKPSEWKFKIWIHIQMRFRYSKI